MQKTYITQRSTFSLWSFVFIDFVMQWQTKELYKHNNSEVRFQKISVRIIKVANKLSFLLGYKFATNPNVMQKQLYLFYEP